MKANRLLAVDDEAPICDLIRDVAEPMDYDFRGVNSVEEFVRAYDEFNPTAAIIDLSLGDGDGVQILKLLADRQTRARIVLLSGADSKLLDATRNIGEEYSLPMIDTLTKPVAIDDLEAALFKCMLKLSERDLKAEDLCTAIDQGDITVHYQPIVRIAARGDGASHSAEALVRWRHPERGLLLPDAFIGLADDDEIMIRMTDVVLMQAVEQIARWRDAGTELDVAVNVTCGVIDDPGFPERLVQLMRQHDVDPARLTLELSERGSILDVVKRLDVLTQLRLKGFGLALDDFGTGTSSLLHLHRLPFSALKIDRSFIKEIVDSRKASVLVKSIIDLAHNLEMDVCAEGVSDARVLKMLAGYDCDLAQGFLFSEPVAAGDIGELLKSLNLKKLLS